MPSLIGGIIWLVGVYSLSTFWAFIVLIRTILSNIGNPSRFWYIKQRPTKPSVLDQGFQHGFLDLYGGKIKIHYVEAGDRNKPLLLLVHGFPEFWYCWKYQIHAFEKDYHVVAIDMRGYGESSKPTSVSDYSMQELVEDFRQIIFGFGKGSCYLVTHDWGSIVAYRFAMLYPEMIVKLVIMNCPHPAAFKQQLTTDWRQLLRSWYMFFFLFPYFPEALIKANDFELLETMLKKPPAGCTDPNALTQEDIEAWKYTYQQPGTLTAVVNYYRSLIPWLPWQEKEKGDSDIIRPPTLIIWGTNDVALGTEMAQNSLRRCANGQLQIIEGASHWTQFDRPDLTNQYIRDFLQS